MQLKQGLLQRFTLAKQGKVRPDAPVRLIEEALRSKVLPQIQKVLEHQAHLPPASQWLELAQFECLQVVSLMLRGSGEQIIFISRSGIQSPVLNLLRHPSGTMRLAAVKCLAVLAQLPFTDSRLFDALADSSQYALTESELDILLATIPAMHAFMVSHGTHRQGLPRLLQLLAKVMATRNKELERVALAVIRELTVGIRSSTAPIQLAASEETGEGQKTVSLTDLPGKNPYHCAKLVFDLGISTHIIRLLSSQCEELAFEAAVVFCQLLKLMPGPVEAIIRFGRIQVAFDVLSIVYCSEADAQFKSKACFDVISIIARMIDEEAWVLEEVREMRSTRPSSTLVQGVPLLILISSSPAPEIAGLAKSILQRVFQKTAISTPVSR